MKKLFLCFLLVVVYQQQVLAGQLHKFCTDNWNADACAQISRDQDINCQYAISKTDCVLDADIGLPTFTVLTAEEAFLAAGLVSENTVVFGEIVPENPPYQTVVIVRAGYLGGFGDQLKGLKFCHPGYDHDERITRYVLEELDSKAVNQLRCSFTETLTELKYQGLAEFFGSSCRPGKWAEDSEFDAYLKNKYSSLCELCGSNGCDTKYKVPLNDSLTCLSENSADVALSSLAYANTFFSIGSNAQDFQFLCPNGTVAPSTSPCTWTSQLNKVFITSSESAATMQAYVQSKLPSYVNPDDNSGSSTVEQYWASLLQLSRTDRINLIFVTQLSTYVSERRTIPLPNDGGTIQCGPTITWSVTNEAEEAKCTWLRQASVTHGLLPVVKCTKSNENDTVSNLDNIKNTDEALGYIDANFGYIARRKNLTNVAYPETDTRQLSKIVIVVRNDSTWYEGKLSDLEQKRICIPEYGGKEWLAFIDLLRTNKILTDSCDYGALFSGFVGESCAPGANAKDIDIPNTDSTKLCSNCYPVDDTTVSRYCNADPANKYYDSLGSLTCLQENNADYAVIALNDLPRDYLRNTDLHQQFRVISKNGSLAAYNGFEVDEEAPIAIIISGEVVFKNTTEAKYNDTVLYLRQLELEFGQNLEKSFKVFERFNHSLNLLFPDSTPGLTFGDTSNKYIENYKSLLQNSETCGGFINGGSHIFAFSALAGVSVIFALLL